MAITIKLHDFRDRESYKKYLADRENEVTAYRLAEYRFAWAKCDGSNVSLLDVGTDFGTAIKSLLSFDLGDSYRELYSAYGYGGFLGFPENGTNQELEEAVRENFSDITDHLLDNVIIDMFVSSSPFLRNEHSLPEEYLEFDRHTVSADLHDWKGKDFPEYFTSKRKWPVMVSEELMNRHIEMGERIELILAVLHDQIVVGVLFLVDRDRVHYHFSTIDYRKAKYRITDFILYNAIKKFTQEGKRELHLGGGRSKDLDEPLYKFKRGYGNQVNGYFISKVYRIVLATKESGEKREFRYLGFSQFEMQKRRFSFVNKPVIGGEFSLDPNLLTKEDASSSVDLYLSTNFNNLSLYASGRDAIYALVDHLKPQIVYLPDYICKSIYRPFKHSGDVDIRYYRVREDLSVDDSFLETIQENDMRILFVVLSYFGKVDDHLLTSLVNYRSRNERSRILLDITHSLFDKSLPSQLCHSDYSVCSLRKWFFLPDGGFLAGRELIPYPINDARVDFWSERTGAGLLRYFGTRTFDTDDDYEAMELAEASLDNKLEMGYRISSFSKIVLKKLDFEKTWMTRKQNFEVISNYVGKLDLEILVPDSSSFFTVAVVFDNKQKRDGVRAELKNKRIACPIHWDTSWMKRTHNLSELTLSIPCDQRIGSEEIYWLKKAMREVIDCA